MVSGFNPFKRTWEYVRWCYFQFAVHTCITMLEPVEEKLLNSCLLLVLAMVMYVTYTYLPGHLLMLFNFACNITGIQR